MQAAIRGEFNSRTELSHFTPNAVIETSPLNDIKLNPCALARSIEEPEPMSYEDEEKLFKKSPELFEKRMIIIDGSNVARWLVTILIAKDLAFRIRIKNKYFVTALSIQTVYFR